MKKPVNRVAAIHDLSGFGRSSLAVIIPIISTMGVQVCPVPTAVLSTHTGGFKNYCFIDLTNHMEAYVGHWHQLGIEFDCIYSGFLGSSKQIDIIKKFISDFSANGPLVVVDPVLGDNGCLYSAINKQMVREMGRLIKKADIITPNFTEAAYLLGEAYRQNVTEAEIEEWLLRLSEMGPKIVIITNVPDNALPNKIGVMAYNRQDGRFLKIRHDYVPVHYPGVGDIFTSVIVGSMVKGDSLPTAMNRAVQFTTAAIKTSYNLKYPEREGVVLEQVLNKL